MEISGELCVKTMEIAGVVHFGRQREFWVFLFFFWIALHENTRNLVKKWVTKILSWLGLGMGITIWNSADSSSGVCFFCIFGESLGIELTVVYMYRPFGTSFGRDFEVSYFDN